MHPNSQDFILPCSGVDISSELTQGQFWGWVFNPRMFWGLQHAADPVLLVLKPSESYTAQFLVLNSTLLYVKINIILVHATSNFTMSMFLT